MCTSFPNQSCLLCHSNQSKKGENQYMDVLSKLKVDSDLAKESGSKGPFVHVDASTGMGVSFILPCFLLGLSS